MPALSLIQLRQLIENIVQELVDVHGLSTSLCIKFQHLTYLVGVDSEKHAVSFVSHNEDEVARERPPPLSVNDTVPPRVDKSSSSRAVGSHERIRFLVLSSNCSTSLISFSVAMTQWLPSAPRSARPSSVFNICTTS